MSATKCGARIFLPIQRPRFTPGFQPPKSKRFGCPAKRFHHRRNGKGKNWHSPIIRPAARGLYLAPSFFKKYQYPLWRGRLHSTAPVRLSPLDRKVRTNRCPVCPGRKATSSPKSLTKFLRSARATKKKDCDLAMAVFGSPVFTDPGLELTPK